MNKEQALQKMISPGIHRRGKPMDGVIQIHLTRACDKACFGCTQGSNLGGKTSFMSLENFEQACISLKDYFGIVGIFGGNPAMHPQFEAICGILQEHIPKPRRGLWCNHPKGHGKDMRETFNPAVSNLNVHLDQEAWNEFRRDWPECKPFGLDKDSRHSPVYTAMQDLIKEPCSDCGGKGKYDWDEYSIYHVDSGKQCANCKGTGLQPREEEIWDLISRCDINQNWSAMIAEFRGQLRGYFCEIAGAQAQLHQHEENYPDLGVPIPTEDRQPWWKRTMIDFQDQVQFHCFGCGFPMKGFGELAQTEDGKEQVSETHAEIYKPKKRDREVQLVQLREDVFENSLAKGTHYLQNSEVKI